MNRLLIDENNNELDLKDNVFYLDIKSENIIINIKGRVLINEFNIVNNDKVEIIINMSNNSELLYNRYIDTNNMDTKIVINQDSNSSVEFNYSIVAKDSGKLVFSSNVLGSHNITNIRVRGITKDNGALELKCVTDNKERTEDNELLESLKILMLNDKESIIIPDLLVASNEVAVNHAATIGGINKDELFYLTSKGISEESAKKLISEGFVINNLNLSNKDKEELEGLIGE